MHNKPNILFLLSDQQRADSIHCYGQPLDITPNLDQLAAHGVRFAETHTPQPVCGPARACLQTGQWASRTGVEVNGIPLPTDRPLLARMMREGGYEVGYLGKWHLASSRHTDPPISFRDRGVPPERRGGFDDYWLAADSLEHTSHSYDGHVWDQNGDRRDFPRDRYRVDVITDWLLEYLDGRNGDKPWFCFCSWIEPHHQNDHNRYEGPHGSADRFRNPPIPEDLRGLDGDWDKEYPDYLGCVASLDENVGRIIAKLRDMGTLENTLVIYTSDHGSHFRTRNSEYKRSCHRASTHVPCIIRGPGFSPGSVFHDFVSLIDLPPTILAAAGIAIPEGFDGRPVQDLLAGNDDWPDDVFIQISESQIGRAVRTRDWCYCIDKSEDGEVWIEQYLYDLKNDPAEHVNQVRNPAFNTERTDLRTRLVRRMVAAGERTPVVLPASDA